MAKKKKKNTVIVLLGVLIVACGAYVGVLKYNEAQEGKGTEEEDTSIPIIAMEDVVAVSYDNETAALSFVKQEDTWINTEQEDFPLMQNRINSIANAMKNMSANRKLDDTDDLSQYGLDDVTKTVTAEDADGNTKTLKIGDVNEYTGDYYAMVEGDDSVYTISEGIVNYTDYTLDDLLQLDTVISVTSAQANTVTIEKNGTQVKFEKREVEAEEETQEETQAESAGEDSETEAQTDSTETAETQAMEEAWFAITDSGENRLEDEAETELNTAINSAGGSSVASCVNYKVEGEDRAQYGLDETNETIITMDFTAADEDGTSVLHVGNLDDSGNYYYVGVGDSKAVNLIEKDSLERMLELLK